MSELITNLQAIYNTKLALKEAIGTVSDNFVDYPSYISGMVTPTGTYNISDNGTFDVSTYASAYVNISGGGGVEYSIVDLSYSSFVANSKYEICVECKFNEYALDAATCETYGIDSKYVGWQVHIIRTHNIDDEYYGGLLGIAVTENTVSDSDGVYVLHLTYIQTIVQGSNPFFEIDEIASVSYYGGNSSYTLTDNGNYYTGMYSYLTVNVPQSIGLPYDVTESFYQLNGTTLKYIMEDSGEPRWICSLDPNQSASFTILYYTGSNVFHGLSSALSNTIDDTNVGVGSMNNDRLSSQTSDFGAFTINNTSSKVVSISIYCNYRSNTTIDLDLSWVADEPKE